MNPPVTPTLVSPSPLLMAAFMRDRRRFHLLLTQSQDLVLAISVAGRCLMVSHSVSQCLGYANSALVGTSLAELIHPQDWPRFQRTLQSCVRRPSLPKTVSRSRWCDQSGRWRVLRITLVAVPVYGRALEVLAIAHDITGEQHSRVMEAALAQTEARYLRIVERAGEGIYQITPDGRYISANPKLAQLLGYDSPQTLLGDSRHTKADDYLDPMRWVDFICLMDQQGGQLLDFESQLKRRDGRTLWVLENVQAVYDKAGQVVCYEGAIADITERRRAEEALRYANEDLETRVQQRTAALTHTNQQLQVEIAERERAQASLRLGYQALDACSNGIVIVEVLEDARCDLMEGIADTYDPPAALMIYVNPAFERMMGYRREEIIGKPYLMLSQAAQADERDRLRAAIIERQDYRAVLRYDHKDGRPMWVELRLSPISNEAGEISHLVGIHNDITDYRQLQEELQSALNAQRELNDLKSQFITTASHEFRTPLATILSSSKLLEDYSDRLTPDRRQTHFTRIQTAIEHLTQLLDDVLHVSNIELGTVQLNIQPIDLADLCQEAIAITQKYHPKAMIEFVAGDGLLAQTSQHRPCLDPQLVQRILVDLLSNAVKYSPSQAPITLSADMLDATSTPTIPLGNGAVVLAVSDRGRGIPPAEHDQVFESFYRASNAGNVQGTGLGLTIVKNAVDLHNGTIVIASEVDQGTTVTVQLPIHRWTGRSATAPISSR